MIEILKSFVNIFPGVESFLMMKPEMAIARILLILLGFFLCYLGHKKILDPLLMVPMGVGIAMVNAGILIMPNTGKLGTMFLNALVESPQQHIDAFQIYFLQPIYALTFSNGLIACLVFIGIGSITELDFFIANPFPSIGLSQLFLFLVISIILQSTPRFDVNNFCIFISFFHRI